MVTAALSILLLIFTFIRFVDKPSAFDRTIWAWLGLILAIVIVAGAWLNMKAAGESGAGMMDRFGSKEPAASAPAAPAPRSAARGSNARAAGRADVGGAREASTDDGIDTARPVS